MPRAALIALMVACSSHRDRAPAQTGCNTDGECVIACPGSCCQLACGSAMTRSAAEAAATVPTRTCSQDDVASCAPPTHDTAACRDHACVALPPEPRKSTAIDLQHYSLACGSNADCTLVEADPCSPCRCTSEPISTAESGRYAAARGAIHCRASEGADITIEPCVHCDAVIPVCNANTCAAKSIEVMPADGECQTDADCVISCTTEGRCCEPAGCETVVSKAHADAVQRGCQPGELAECPNRGKPDYIRPVCKVGKCFAKVLR